MCMLALEVLLQQMRWERDFHECVTAAAVASMFVAAICFQRWIDWVEDLLLWKVHRSLSLISSCCYNYAIKLLTPEGKVSEFAYQEQQTARASVHTLESNIPILRHSFCKQISRAPTRSHPPSPTVPTETLQEKTQNKTYNKREEERFACTCTWWQEADEILFQAKTE